jgi:methylmalonyl-CoA mutase N-terminal domain/subunit
MERTSESGLPIDPVYDESKLTDFRPDERLGRPGRYPFTRGVCPRTFLDRPPAMRQFAGERVTGDVLYQLRDALRADAAFGEVCDALRDVWGTGWPERI